MLHTTVSMCENLKGFDVLRLGFICAVALLFPVPSLQSESEKKSLDVIKLSRVKKKTNKLGFEFE